MSVRHVPVQLSLDLRLLDRVDAAVVRAEAKRSGWIAEAIRQRLDREERRAHEDANSQA